MGKPRSRLAKARWSLRTLWRARDNLLELWGPWAFTELGVLKHRFLGRWVFLANSPEAVKQVLVTNVENYPKSKYTKRALEPLVGEGLFISQGDLWKRQRRLATPALHGRHMHKYAKDMVQTTDEMLRRWDKRGEGSEIEMTREMTRVTAEVVCRTMFSDDLGSRAQLVFDAFTSYQESLGKLDFAEVIGLGAWVPRWGTIAGRRAAAQLDSVLNEIIVSRLENLSEKNDLLSHLLNMRNVKNDMVRAQKLVRDEAAVMILAGHETAANALCWTWYLLSQSPEVERQVHEELDKILGARSPNYDDVSKLAYVRAVIEEAMRLYPPLHIFSRESRGEDVIEEQRIPSGAMIIIAPWCLHRHEKLWSEPNAFRPERFLPENKGERQQYAYLPFGAGPRTCLGSGFAMVELILIVAMVSQRFQLHLKPATCVEPLGRLTLRPRYGLQMILERRQKTGGNSTLFGC